MDACMSFVQGGAIGYIHKAVVKDSRDFYGRSTLKVHPGCGLWNARNYVRWRLVRSSITCPRCLQKMTQLSNIPPALHPIVNQIAWELYRLRGYQQRDDYDFSKATHPHEVEAYRAAIVALETLQDFCLDNWGSDLSLLVDNPVEEI